MDTSSPACRMAAPAGPPPARTRALTRPYELRVADLVVRGADGRHTAVADADLLLPPGRRAGLLGPGAPMLSAVLRRVLDYRGTVTVNGVQLRDLGGRTARRIIARCAPDCPLFDATIAENVRTARPAATGDEVTGTLRRAGVGLPPGARVGDGAAVPADERRRIALARALLADAPVILIDESDPGDGPGEGEGLRRLLPDLLRIAEGRTVLVVSPWAAVPGADPLLRDLDEVRALSASPARPPGAWPS